MIPALTKKGIRFLRRAHWNDDQRAWLSDYVQSQVLATVTPLSIDPAHPFPRVANKNLHFIVCLHGKDAFGHRCALVPNPHSLPRLVRLPLKDTARKLAVLFGSSLPVWPTAT
ncbi:MAG: hypothetical protein ACK4JF_09575 [Methylohalobius sp.]